MDLQEHGNEHENEHKNEHENEHEHEHEPTVIIDFHHKRLRFEKPLHVWQTSRLDEVKPIFEQAQVAIRDQLYVAGFVSYECAPAFDDHYVVCDPDPSFPLVWFAAYESPIEEHASASAPALTEASASESTEPIAPAPKSAETSARAISTAPALTEAPALALSPIAPSPSPSAPATFTATEWQNNTDRTTYASHIHSIHEAIARGETYQVNYTTRLRAAFDGNDLAYYEELREVQQGAYSAYLDLGRYRILSVSPELFFHWDGERIRTKPMKGTLPKSENREALLASEKNRTENVMIVDLLRNDMSRVATTGSVQVPKLFEVEEYPTLFQMTSTVEAETKPGVTLFEVFEAMFPCGSITGAPKISTMQLIASLEREPRHIYCGSIGLAVPGEGMTFNVAIRTVLVDRERQQAEYGVGGGVIWDSTAEDEYEEMITKSRVLTYRKELTP
ncbi:aminodeoxychorismate synthase component I [Paenibacillus koleovorans]|uniref:aminodeoxychorismate synthase component I n=1 Tax=Paenibacillus koleovorans TaxID=121608 RepID=UPI001C3F83B9|nr:aminodeoxychorismate synthase component I [Paenibacillus koleovorans]